MHKLACRSRGSRLPTLYSAVVARTRTFHRPVGPVAYDCVKVIVVRDGSAILFNEFGQKPVNFGDVVLLGANVLCGAEPEGPVTTTTIYLDTDYLMDQVFWQYAGLLRDRLDALGFASRLYSEPAQILRIGEDRAGLLMPWLDELVALSIDRDFGAHFNRTQALWFSVANVIGPYVAVTPVRISPSQRARSRPTVPRSRRFAPLREEARRARAAMIGDLAANWTLNDLACVVHLSPRQVARVFIDAYGKTPQAYLTMLRVEKMAQLLRSTSLTIAETGRRVGWRSRSRAEEAFRECTGITPWRYRQMDVPPEGSPGSGQ